MRTFFFGIAIIWSIPSISAEEIVSPALVGVFSCPCIEIPREEIDIVRKSAEKGNAISARLLGLHFARERQKQKAMKWLEASAALGNSISQYDLAQHYHEESDEKWIFWMSLSAEQGLPASVFFINSVIEGESADEQSHGLANNVFLRALVLSGNQDFFKDYQRFFDRELSDSEGMAWGRAVSGEVIIEPGSDLSDEIAMAAALRHQFETARSRLKALLRRDSEILTPYWCGSEELRKDYQRLLSSEREK